MANKDTITNYLALLKQTLINCEIAEVNDDGDIVQDSIISERVYLTEIQMTKATKL